MKGVRIKIFYGYRYYDEEYDIEKTGYDYEVIGDQVSQGRIERLRDRIRDINNNYHP